LWKDADYFALYGSSRQQVSKMISFLLLFLLSEGSNPNFALMAVARPAYVPISFDTFDLWGWNILKWVSKIVYFSSPNLRPSDRG